MPDTLPLQPDLIGSNGAVIADTIAGFDGRSTAPTGVARSLGAGPERAAPPPIARRLAILVIVAILPVLAFSALMIARYADEQRTQYQQQLMATARATTFAVDAELSRRIAVLKTLSNARELKDRDWRAFHDRAKAAVDLPNAWIVVYDPSAQQLLSTLVSYGTDLPKSGNPEGIQRVVETRQPYISDLFVGAISKLPVVAVYLPVMENDAVVNVIAFSLPAIVISRILQTQMQLPGGVGAVFDRNDKLIARSRNESEFIGHLAVPAYREALRNHDEGSLEVRNLEDLLVRSAYVRSTLSGWSTTLAVETATLDAPLWRSLWLFGGGGAALVVLALLCALFYARAIAQPLVALSGMAAALGRGEHIPAQQLNLREAQATADQIHSASEALQQRAREVDHLNATLSEHAKALEVANKELESFAYSVSHDLRVPLRAIDGFSQILAKDFADKLDAEGRRILQVVRDGATRMGRLIDDILAFSRVGRQAIAASTTDTAALVQDALRELAAFMAGRTIEMKIAPLPRVRGDPVMLQRVWINLLANAIKFTGPQPNAVIEVGSRAEGNETVFFVKDNGAGFDMKYVDKLFGVFQRLHRIEDFPGTGIGLAIVNRIVIRHGGRVWAEGKVGEGATFSFALPATATSHD